MRFITILDKDGEEWLLPLRQIRAAAVRNGNPFILTKYQNKAIEVSTPFDEIVAKIAEASK